MSNRSQVVNLWKEICAALEKLPKTDSQTLRHLDVLVTAGFVSRRRGIASISVSMWNNTFGKQDALEYPVQLEQALQKLGNTFTLSLPSLEADISDTVSSKCSILDLITNIHRMVWLPSTIPMDMPILRCEGTKVHVSRNRLSVSLRVPGSRGLQQYQALTVDGLLPVRRLNPAFDMMIRRLNSSLSLDHLC